MFRAAVLKLTAWYLGIVIAISLAFSAAIFHVSYSEVSLRLANYRTAIIEDTQLPINVANAILQNQSEQAALQLLMMLVYLNIIIFVVGGVGSYLLARRTLDPIEEAHEAQSRFTSDVSHELRTPLASLKTEIEVALISKDMPKKDVSELLKSNLEEVDKLIQLTEMLLKLSRLDTHKLEIERVDLPSIAKNIVNKLPQKNRVKLTAPAKLQIKGNKSAITEIIHILLDNAIKYSVPDSEIEINISRRNVNSLIQIVNIGSKISDKELSKIFDRFYQVESSRNSKENKGHGLGLSIASKLVDLHHGEIKAKSIKGINSFSVYLPISSYHLKDSSKLQQKK